MGVELAGGFNWSSVFLAGFWLEAEDRADVVQASRGDPVRFRRVVAGHDPVGAEVDGVGLVGGQSVPNQELTILRGRH